MDRHRNRTKPPSIGNLAQIFGTIPAQGELPAALEFPNNRIMIHLVSRPTAHSAKQKRTSSRRFAPRLTDAIPRSDGDKQPESILPSMAETERFLLLEEPLPSLVDEKGVPSAGHLRRLIIVLALPVLAEQILAMLVGFSDRLLTGHFLSTEHLAAITVIGYLLWLVYGVFSVFSLGTSAIVARAVGAGSFAEANRAFHHGLVLALLISVPTCVAGWLLTSQVVFALQLRGEAGTAAAEYLRIVIPCAPLIAIQAVSVSCLRAAGNMMAGFLVMSVVNALNIVVSWVLCLGVGPLPRLGWVGLAVGTASGFVGGTAALAALLLRGRSGLRLPSLPLQWEPVLVMRILKVGIPGGIDNLAVIGCQLWFLALINRLGSVATAAHGVALSIEAVAFLPGIAIQAAASTLAGQFLGAKRPQEATSAVTTARNLGCFVMGGAGLVLILVAPWLPYAFVSTAQQEVASAAAPLLRIIGVGMVPLAVVMVISSGLRGAGDTARTLVVSLVGFLGVRIPATYLLAFPSVVLTGGMSVGGLDLGVIGAWYAMVLDLSVRALLLHWHFRTGRWTKIQV